MTHPLFGVMLKLETLGSFFLEWVTKEKVNICAAYQTLPYVVNFV